MIKLELTPREHKELKSILYGFEKERSIVELRNEFYSLKIKTMQAKYQSETEYLDEVDRICKDFGGDDKDHLHSQIMKLIEDII